MVFISSTILIGVIVAIFLYRIISLKKVATINALTRSMQEMQSEYNGLIEKRRQLKAELAKKEKRLTTMRNNQEGIHIQTTEGMNIREESSDDKISSRLLSSGKITLEQSEKARKKMGLLKMDFLTTCVALGFIDAEDSKEFK